MAIEGGECGKNANTAKLSKLLEVDTSTGEADIKADIKASQKLAGEVEEIACGYEVPIGYEKQCLCDGVGEEDKSDSTVAPSSTMSSPSLVAESAPYSESDAEGLQALYATAYGGWISPPGATEEVVYLSPTSASSNKSVGHPGAPRAAWVETTLELADQHGGLFGLTAFNPLGQDTPHAENLAQDKLLEEDVMKLCAKTGGSWWRAFGFADGWHEMGFTVAAPQDEMVELAKKYGQAAVYRFSRNRTPGLDAPFLRAVVPALILDTESEVPVSPVARPALDRADPFWQPSDREASDSDF